MKLSAAAVTVAAISLLHTTHAAPLAFKDGEITGRLHYRRGSELSDVEPGSHLILPRILNFIKRQVTTGAAIATAAPDVNGWDSQSTGATSGKSDTDLHTSIMAPDLESYGFASELGSASALAPVRE